jgi:hypothetical protein
VGLVNKNTKIIIRKTRNQIVSTEDNPINYDVATLLKEGASRIYTKAGRKLMEKKTNEKP